MRNLLVALMFASTPAAVQAAETDWSSAPKSDEIVRSMISMKLTAAEAAVPATPPVIAPLTPETIAFLKSIGLDADSEDVQVAHQDGTISSIFRGKPISHSLESLAKEGSKKGVPSFITSRVFIRKLKADFAGTPIPKVGYDGIYLTNDERLLVADKLTEGFSPK